MPQYSPVSEGVH